MQIGLVVDATCDLPKHYIDQHQIQVLPISIRIGDAAVSYTHLTLPTTPYV